MSTAAAAVPAYRIVWRNGSTRHICGHCAAANGPPKLDQRDYLFIETIYTFNSLNADFTRPALARCDCGRRAIPHLR